jgi:Poly(ADP-ribose) polymerase catalytic domain./Poly(ADP-ribose) polymerase, regulatory domain./WGR domain.
MDIIKSTTMIMSNIDGNNNKFWTIELKKDFTVCVTNGRIGGAGQKQPPKGFSSIDGAERFISSKIKEKEKKGYKSFDGITSTNNTQLSKTALEQTATNQIRTKGNKDIIYELIKKMVRSNIHNILQNTDLKYDEDSGLFKTPVGYVTKNSIKQARELLLQMSPLIQSMDFDSVKIKELLSEYLMLIPQKVGSKLTVKSIIPNDDAIQKQNGILDDLESSVQQVEMNALSNTKKDIINEVNNTFNAELSLVTDNGVIDRIRRFYDSTRQGIHASHKLSISRVFEVRIDEMDSAFDNSLGNIMELWHGTRVGNVLSILKSGLMIPPSNARHVTGRMFGNGLYFSDQSTKSLNYSYGYWDGGSKDNVCYMFLCDVAMGRAYTPRSPNELLPKNGSDSTFAKGNQSGVKNNEMIVYKAKQANPRFLVEFA